MLKKAKSQLVLFDARMTGVERCLKMPRAWARISCLLDEGDGLGLQEAAEDLSTGLTAVLANCNKNEAFVNIIASIIMHYVIVHIGNF